MTVLLNGRVMHVLAVPESYTMVAESKFQVCNILFYFILFYFLVVLAISLQPLTSYKQVPVEVLFNFLFSDGAFDFLDDYHKKCGDKGSHLSFPCTMNVFRPVKVFRIVTWMTCRF